MDAVKSDMETSGEWADALIKGDPSDKQWIHLEHILMKASMYFSIADDPPESFGEYIGSEEAPVLTIGVATEAKLTDFPVNPNDNRGITDAVPNDVPENGFRALKHYYENGYVDRDLAEEWIDWCRR
jgi:hypothetical protein